MSDVVVLNVDESTPQSLGTYGFDGLVRSSHGAFLRGFYGFTRNANIIFAEIRALLMGISLC